MEEVSNKLKAFLKGLDKPCPATISFLPKGDETESFSYEDGRLTIYARNLQRAQVYTEILRKHKGKPSALKSKKSRRGHKNF